MSGKRNSKKSGKAGVPGRAPRGTPRRKMLFWDRIWMRRSERIRIPPWAHRLLGVFVRSGDGWGWLFVTLALSVFLPRERVVFLVVQAVFTLSLSLPLYWLLKLTIRRTRPFRLFKSVEARVPPLDMYSFPSGHTMNNMAVAASVALHLPWLWPLALVLPLSLGLLRVLYGVHFLTDIVGGALLGLAVALASSALYSWWNPGLPFF